MELAIIIATLDTKGEEALYVKNIIESKHISTLVIDTGIKGQPYFEPDISRYEVANAAGTNLEDLIERNDRGYAVAVMKCGCARVLERLHKTFMPLVRHQQKDENG